MFSNALSAVGGCWRPLVVENVYLHVATLEFLQHKRFLDTGQPRLGAGGEDHKIPLGIQQSRGPRWSTQVSIPQPGKRFPVMYIFFDRKGSPQNVAITCPFFDFQLEDHLADTDI